MACVRAAILVASSSAGTSRPTTSVGCRVSDAQSRSPRNAYDPAAVVRVNGRGGLRIPVGEQPVGGLRSLAVVHSLPVRARRRIRSRRDSEIGEGCSEVESRAAHDHGRPPPSQRRVDRLVGEHLVFADRGLVSEVPDPDERGR
jgi:hypothetical protein